MKIVELFLKSNNRRYNKYIYDNYLESHHDRGSFKAVSDSLKLFGYDNSCLVLSNEKLNKIPFPSIAWCEIDGKHEFVLIKDIKNELILVEYYTTKKTIKNVKLDDFHEIWTGIVLIAEQASLPIIDKGKSINIIICFCSLLFLFLLIWFLLSIANNKMDLLSSIFFINFSIGFVISLLILFKTNGFEIELIDKFCSNSISSKVDCDLVLSSNKSLFGHIPYTLLGGTFNLVGILLILLYSELLWMFSVISICGIPIIGYLLYSQFFELNKICSLCILLSMSYMFSLLSLLFSEFDIGNFYILVIVTIIAFLMNYFFHIFFKIVTESEIGQCKIFNLKTNTNLFKSLLSQECNIPNNIQSIKLNESAQDNVVSVFISLTCPHCKTYIQDLLKVYKVCSDTRFELFIHINEFSVAPNGIMSHDGEEAISLLLGKGQEVKETNSNYSTEYLKWEGRKDITKFPSAFYNGKLIDPLFTCKDLVFHL